ncbi:hypothetical protein AKO1_011437, partial [Acrasis kona]
MELSQKSTMVVFELIQRAIHMFTVTCTNFLEKNYNNLYLKISTGADLIRVVRLLLDNYQIILKKTPALEYKHKALFHRILEARHRWAHQHKFDLESSYRVLDDIQILMTLLNDQNADEVKKMKYAVVCKLADYIRKNVPPSDLFSPIKTTPKKIAYREILVVDTPSPINNKRKMEPSPEIHVNKK